MVTLLALNLAPRLWSKFPHDPTVAIFAGVLTALVCLWPFVPAGRSLAEGFGNGLIAIGATCSVVGFGSAMQGLPAFEKVVDWVTSMPGDPLIGAALAVAVIAGMAGSASGGQGLAHANHQADLHRPIGRGTAPCTAWWPSPPARSIRCRPTAIS